MEEGEDGLDRLETPERVGIAIDLAGVGSRGLACLLDTAILGCAILGLGIGLVLLSRVIGAPAIVLAFIMGFLLQWFYFAAFEAVWNGQTPGKRLLGVRVQKLGGYPIGWTDALVRNFLRLVDFLLLYAVGLVVMLMNDKHQRIGDLAAGTIVVRERSGGLARLETLGYEADPAGSRGTGGRLHLTAEEFETLHEFLHRRPNLETEARFRIQSLLAASLRRRLAARGQLREEWTRQTDSAFLETLDTAFRAGSV